MRPYNIRRAADVTRDLDLIEGFLFQTYQDFGDDPETAFERAAARIEDALAYMRSFVTQPHRGTEHPNIRPGIRTVTNKTFIFYFEVDDPSAQITILAIFFGGMDHRRQMMDRLRR